MSGYIGRNYQVGDLALGSTSGYTFAEKLIVGDGDANDGITIQSGTTHQGNLAFNKGGSTTANGRILYQHDTDFMSFWTDSTEQMKITSTGNVEMGGDLDVTGHLSASSLTLGNYEQIYWSSTTLMYGHATNGISFLTQGATRLKIQDNGNIEMDSNLDVSGIIYGDSGASGNLVLKSTSGNSNRSSIEIGTILNSDNGGISFSTAGTSTETTRMRISGTTGNVGIGTGTTSPEGKLSVMGDLHVGLNTSVTGRGLVVSTSNGSVTDDTVSFDAQFSTGELVYKTGGTERMRITSAGKVLLGGVSDVVASSNAPHKLNIPDGLTFGGSAYTYASLHGSGGNVVLSANAYPANTGTESTITFKTSTAAGGQGQDVVIKNGKVGIGTSSIDGTLHVDGGTSTDIIIEKDGGGGAGIRFHNDGSQLSYIQLDASEDMIQYGASGVNQIIYAGGYERMRISSGGYVGIGTTNPTEKLEVDGSLRVGNLKIQDSAGGRIGFNRNTANGAIYDSNYKAHQINGAFAGTDYLDIQSYSSTGTYEGSVVVNSGKVGIGTTAPGALLETSKTTNNTKHFRIHRPGFAEFGIGITGSTLAISANSGMPPTSDQGIFMPFNSGNVGIGTDNPSYNLVVSNGGASGIEFATTTSTQNLIQHYNRSTATYNSVKHIASEHRFNISGASTNLMTVSSSGLDVTGTVTSNGLTIGDDDILTLGDSSEFTLKHHNSGYTHLTNTTGALYIDSDSVVFRDYDGSPVNVVIDQTGIDVTGTVNSTGEMRITNPSADSQLYLYGASGYKANIILNEYGVRAWHIGAGTYTSGQFSISDGTTERLRITSTGNVEMNGNLDVTGNVTLSGTVDGRDVATDGTKLDGIASNAQVNTTSEPISYITGLQTALNLKASITYVDQEIAALVDSSPAALDTLNELAAALGDDANHVTTMTNLIGAKLSLSGGVMSGDLNMATNEIYLGTNGKLRIGNGQDLEIYHDASNSHIKSRNTGSLYVASEGSGDLYLRSDDDIFIQGQGGENSITVTGDAGVSIYHDNIKKLETTSSGIDVTGSVTASLDLSSGRDVYVANGRIVRFTGGSAGSTNKIMFGDTAGTSGDLSFIRTSDSSEHFRITGAGNVGIGTSSPSFPLDVSAPIGSTIGQTSTYNYSSNRNWALRTNNYGSSNWGGWSLEQSTGQDLAPSIARIGVHLNGNVGINMGGDASSGLTSINPATALHVGGDITVGCADTVGASGTASIRFQNDNERSRITSNYDSGGGGRLGFWTDTTGGTLVERLTIKNTGNVEMSGNLKLSTVPSTTANAFVPILFQPTEGTISGDSALTWNPAQDALDINGTHITSNYIRSSGTNSLKFGTASAGQIVELTSTGNVEMNGNLDVTGRVTAGNMVTDSYIDWRVSGVVKGNITANSTTMLINTQGTNTTINESGGNVGIGVAVPAYNLDVVGSGVVAMIRTPNTSSPTLGLMVNSGANGVGTISVDNGGHMTFDTGSTGSGQTERMRISSTGNVGIGTTNPAVKLSNTATRIGNADGLTTHLSGFNWELSGQGYVSAFSNLSTGSGAHNSGLLVELGSTDATDKILDLESGGVNRVRVLGNGNVGIGTTSPDKALVVEHNSSATSINSIYRSNESTTSYRAGGGFASTGSSNPLNRNARLWLDADGANFSGTDYFYIDKKGYSGPTRLVQQSPSSLSLATSGIDRMTITATGDVEMDGDLAVDGVVKSGFGLFEHANTITSNYTITSGNNALTAGPITISSGVSITIPSGSTWVIT